MSSTTTKHINIHADVDVNAVLSYPLQPTTARSLPTIVFLHFWGGSHRTWSLITPSISARYPTVAIDFRGWGDSKGPNAANAYSISTLADDVEAIIASLQLSSFILVGLSMGAKVAQLIAGWMSSNDRKNHTGLLGIILISPAPPTPLTLPSEMRDQQLHAYDTQESASFVATKVLTASFQTSLPYQAELPGFVVEDMLRGNMWAKKAWPAYAMEEDVSDAARNIKVPVLVLAAENDVVEPIERVKREVGGHILGARIEIIPVSGHLSPIDSPDVVAEHVLQFIEGLEVAN